MTLKLLNTTVFRLSLVYVLLFSLVAAVAMGFIYWVAKDHIAQQTDTRLRLESQVLAEHYRTGSMGSLQETVRLRNRDSARGDKRFFVYALTDQIMSDSLKNGEDYFQEGRLTFATLTYAQVLRLVSIPAYASQSDKARTLVTDLQGGWQLLVAADLSEQRALLEKMRGSIWAAIGVIAASAILGGVLMGYYVLRRIDGVSKTATSIIKGDLSQRMTVTNRNDEFDRLSEVLNSMLQRTEQLMQAMREVTDNLAHDLRNPLNRLRNRLDLNRFHKPDVQVLQQTQQDALQDVDDLIKTFNALLSIAQAESGVHRDDWEMVNISALVNDLGELYEAVAEEQGLHLSYHAEQGLQIYGNRQLLAQALTNLLDNAVKYTPIGGKLGLEARQLGKKVEISVYDNGPGIPSEQHERVFERFVRLDNARSSVGNGLGLSLVKAFTDLHGATIHLEDNQPGLRVVLRFDTGNTPHPAVRVGNGHP